MAAATIAWAMPVVAQTTANNAASTVSTSKPSRITQAIDEKQLVRL